MTPERATTVNAQLIALEKALLRPEGLQESAWARSLWACEDPFSGYAAWMLPGLRYEIETQSAEGLDAWLSIYAEALDALNTGIEAIAVELAAEN